MLLFSPTLSSVTHNRKTSAISFATRIVQLTAVRVYIGQASLEVPVFCLNDRLRGIVPHGGATGQFLAAHMTFGHIFETGLARPLVSDLKLPTSALPDFPLTDLASLLREDGFLF